MASLFRPVTVKPIPPTAEPVPGSGGKKIRWKSRTGEWINATTTSDGKKCRVRSPVWWIVYRDASGTRRRVRASKERVVAEQILAKLITDLDRGRHGLAPAVSTTSTLFALADEYRDYLRDMGRTEKHYVEVRRSIRAVAADCKWVRPSDVTLKAWGRWVGEQEFAAESLNHYLRALRGLLRWLVRTDRLPSDPLAAAELLNAEADRRIIRRALLPDEFRRLIDTTRASTKRRQHLDGPSRAALYLFAARTGFRAGVLAKLRKEDVRLDDPTPHIPTGAKVQKSRKALAIPMSAAFVAELREWLESRPDGLLWPGKWHYPNMAGAKMLRKDLKAAGIPVTTADGTIDFHAFRGQAATDLALAGVPLHLTQQFLGHSTPGVTARFYLRVGLGDLAAAAEKVSG